MLRQLDARATRLGERVKAFILDERSDSFESMAMAIFDYQYARNPAYRRFCEMRGVSPGTASGWTDVPAVPAEAFKRVALTCADASLVFRTSGTREGRGQRGAHHVADPDLYALALTETFRRFVLPDVARIRTFSLVPAFEEESDSSLSYMSRVVLGHFGAAESGTFVAAHEVLHGALFAALDRATREGVPVLLFGTSRALAAVVDTATDSGVSWSLPPGSRLVDTGGTKGKSGAYEEAELPTRYRDCFGLPPAACANEYGMTEMLSQLYNPDLALLAARSWRDRGPIDRRLKMGPHWTRSRIVDPETLRGADEGLILHADLANVHSVMAILTEDVGRPSDGGVLLAGRRLGSEARGCSLGMDEWLA